MELETERILLRQWQCDDLAVFAEINSDDKAMMHFPALLTRAESDNLALRLMEEISTSGWGMWAAELKRTKEYIGFVGLSTPLTEFPFSPCVEIGWRLHPRYWGNGYATEASEKSLEFAFQNIALTEVIAMTTVSNLRSVAVMKRLGLNNTCQNFMHPKISPENPLAEHLLYRITKKEWEDNYSNKNKYPRIPD